MKQKEVKKSQDTFKILYFYSIELYYLMITFVMMPHRNTAIFNDFKHPVMIIFFRSLTTILVFLCVILDRAKRPILSIYYLNLHYLNTLHQCAVTPSTEEMFMHN